MSWGKIIGGAIGAAMGGPIGAGIGVAIGAGFDGQEDDGREALTASNQEAPFRVMEIGNILRLTSRIIFPAHATYVVVRAGHRNSIVKSFIEVFADDDGDFCIKKRIVDQALTLELPLLALSIERGRDVSLDFGVMVFSGDEFLGVLEVPATVYVSPEQWSAVHWLDPVVDLVSHYALRSGSWTSDKVRLVKSIFEQCINESGSEAEALRQRIKLSPRPSLDDCITALNARFDEDELGGFVLIAAAAVIMEFGLPGRSASDEIKRLGAELHLQPEAVADLLGDIESERANDRGNRNGSDRDTSGNNEMQWAREIMGVPAGADRDAVQNAWRKKISDLHPDKYANLPEVVQNVIKDKAQEINRARDILLR